MNYFVRLIFLGLPILIAAILALHSSISTGNSLQTMQAEYANSFRNFDQNALNATVDTIVKENAALNLSISITDLQTNQTFHYGEDAEFMAASIGKLVTATVFLHEVELGKRNLETRYANLPASTLLEKLIVESDNQAWEALNGSLTHEKLDAYAKDIGLRHYSASANTIASSDLALLLSKLASGKLLANDHTELLLGYMKRASMRSYLVAGTPAGATIYHKTGYLKDRLHDASIISKGNRSFVLVVFSKTNGTYNFERGAVVFQAIAKRVSEIFFT